MCKGHACGLETEIAKRGAAAGAHDRAFPALLPSGGTPLGPLFVGVDSGVAAPVVWGHSADIADERENVIVKTMIQMKKGETKRCFPNVRTIPRTTRKHFHCKGS